MGSNMKTYKRDTCLKICQYFLGTFFCFSMLILCSKRQFILHHGKTMRNFNENLKVLGLTEERKLPKSIYDAYDFSNLDKPTLWRNGKYSSLYNLTEKDLKSFMSFKEDQYSKRGSHITKQCKFIQATAKHSSQKSTTCNINDDQRCLIVIDPDHKIGFCRNPKVSSTTWLARFKIILEKFNANHTFSRKEQANFHESASGWWKISNKKKMAMLKRQSILSFVFVRHPLDRLESAYYDEIVGNPTNFFHKLV